MPCGPSPPPCRLRSAFCVLCCGGRSKQRPRHMRKCTQKLSEKTQTKSIKNHPKIDQKSPKIEVWRGPGRAWGRSWDHSAPQGCPKGARNQKSDEKFAQPPFVPQSLGSQKSSIFDICLRFLLTFLWSFFGGAFWRPPTTNFRGCWCVFLIVF